MVTVVRMTSVPRPSSSEYSTSNAAASPGMVRSTSLTMTRTAALSPTSMTGVACDSAVALEVVVREEHLVTALGRAGTHTSVSPSELRCADTPPSPQAATATEAKARQAAAVPATRVREAMTTPSRQPGQTTVSDSWLPDRDGSASFPGATMLLSDDSAQRRM